MTPLFSRYPPWAVRTLLLASLASFPSIGLIGYDAIQQQQLTQHTAQANQQLQIQQQQLRTFREAQRRSLQQKKAQDTPQKTLVMLDSIAGLVTPEVAVLSAEVDSPQLTVRLEVRASSLNSLLAFTQRLHELPVNVELDNHRQATDNNPAWPVSAAIGIHFQRDENHEAAQ